MEVNGLEVCWANQIFCYKPISLMETTKNYVFYGLERVVQTPYVIHYSFILDNITQMTNILVKL